MAGYIKTDGNEYSKAAAKGVPQPWDPKGGAAPGGGGSDLPEYGASDAGKVLSVNEDGDGVEWKEAGGGGGGVFVVVDDGSGTLDKTWKEIHDVALQMLVIGKMVDGDTTYINYLYTVSVDQGEYAVGFLADGMVIYYLTDNENGYPVVYTG